MHILRINDGFKNFRFDLDIKRFNACIHFVNDKSKTFKYYIFNNMPNSGYQSFFQVNLHLILFSVYFGWSIKNK